MPKYTANQVADAILAFGNEHGELVTNLRLQKLLYYCQGWYLAEHGQPLFDDPIEAWLYGPAVPAVYERFRPFAHRPIDSDVALDAQPPELADHVSGVWEAYAHLSTYELERISTAEAPYVNARNGLPFDVPSPTPLSNDDMQRHFAAQWTHA